jgi:spermidine synthase
METEDRTRFLTIDGKTDASTQKTHDMKTQVLLGQLPLLFSETVKDIFIVGLGSGVTAGAVLTHPVDQLTCAEISPAVVEASAYFSHVNHNIFQHAEFEIVARDARNIFLTDDSKFDVIISQPSNPWIDGQSSLFTREWYQLVHSRLREGGIFAQWIPAYQMSQKDVKIIMKTLKAEFPYLTAWTSGSIGDLIFLAKKNGPLRFSYDVYLEKIESDMIYNDIKRLDFNPEALPFDTFVMNNKQIHDYITSHNGSEIQINSDSFLVTEYSTPKKILKKGAVSRFATPAKLSGKLEKLAPIISDLSEAAVIEMGEK